MKHISTLLVTLLFLTSSLLAQKVAITGFNTDCSDGFAFVVLTDLSAGTVVYFTDGTYVAASNSFNVSSTSDVVLSYTVPVGGLTEGTVIRAVEGGGCGFPFSGNNTFTLTRSGGGATGTLTQVGTDNFSLSGGEPLWAFSASNPASPHTSMTDFFGGIVMGGNASGAGDNPTTDANAPRSPDFWYIVLTNFFVDGANYTGTRTNTTLAQLTNTGSWTTSNNNVALSTVPFTTPAFGGGVFPVEWLSFEAEVQGAKVQLSWATASELNNDYFAIERSVDALMFEAIGRQTGAGTSQEIQNYTFTDKEPLAHTLYYRLRQVDFDGSFEYSPIVEVQVEELNVDIAASIYPIPLTNELHVDNVKGTLNLYSVTGQLLRQYRLERYENVIDVSGLDRGYYFALIVDENGNQLSRKLMK